MQRGPERVFDEYLVAASQAGSRAAFDALARRWTPRLLRYAARTLGPGRDSAETVRDVVQETWLGAIRGLHRLADPVQFPAWIYAITTRKCADAIRKAVRARRLNASLQAEAATKPRGSETDTAAELDLASGIAGLPQDQRAVVYLFYGEDLGIEEIAATLDIPAGTVKSRLHHARNALKRYMQPLSTVTQIGRTRHDRHR